MPICGAYAHNLTDVQEVVGCLPTESWYYCGYLCLHKPSFLLESALKKTTDSCSTCILTLNEIYPVA